MKPGDVIKQRYQACAAERIVLAKMPNACVVVLEVDHNYKIKVVLGWSHDVVREGTQDDFDAARRVLALEQVQEALVRWFLGNQVSDRRSTHGTTTHLYGTQDSDSTF